MSPVGGFVDGFWFSVELLATAAGLCTPLFLAGFLFLWALPYMGPRVGHFLFGRRAGRRLTDRA